MHGRHGFKFGPGFMGWMKGFGFDTPRMRRGDIKYLILEVLKEGPRHGYDIINSLGERFRGYRPSPGSVYPTLQMLEDGGFVTSQEVDGKKVYTITENGMKLLEESGDRGFRDVSEVPPGFELWQSLGKLAAAVNEGGRGADEATIGRLTEILDKARKEVYSVLAES